MNNYEPCFEVCPCSCGNVDATFDQVIREETKFEITLHDLCHKNILWFQDLSHCDERVNGWNLEGKSGIYLLWSRDDYCPIHQNFHCSALYVGKGNIKNRLSSHITKKDFSEEMIVFASYIEIPNRISKYIEQLLLDTYRFARNKSEAKGTRTFCHHLSQTESDFGALNS